ncbi:ATP-binding protein [Bifidobacterium aerophilum]|uniref:GHKL domain-containing protein n=1 Tax=Bifidobacterium aerophilum TaxID=1798155 RepID=A0A6N9Z6T2_9BIFI|nr:ATP-binding protein [Bifidobacterium aerophilum]NEG90417.1 GHKL domain-containing protein [Bifidobacterium aerophilum]
MIIGSFYLFPLELVCATLLFCHGRWEWFSWPAILLRLAVFVAYMVAFGLAFSPLVGLISGVEPDRTLSVTLSSIVYFATCAVALMAVLHLACGIRWLESGVIVVAGYAVQHIAFDLFQIALLLGTAHAMNAPWQYLSLRLAVFVVVYAAMFAAFARRFVVDSEKVRGKIRWVVFCTGILAFVIVFNMFTPDGDNRVQLTGHAYSLVCGILVLGMLMLAVANDRLHGDLELLRQVDRLKAEQYELTREKIDLINIKCHDIRKIVASAAGAGGLSKETLRDIEDNIRVYDAIFRTGNDALDALLTEKSLYCSGNGIALTCSADGRRLGFMDRADLYSLFGNVLDNAVESAQRVPQDGKRVIDFTIADKGGLLVVKETNYYDESHPLTFRDGLPVTTKDDSGYHGFGMKSIARQVAKYGGDMTIDAADGLFSLTIVLPVPE